MIDEVLKDLIYDLEGLLKKDKRFKANGDNQYRKQIKKIYQDSLYGRKPIDFTNLINLNNQVLKNHKIISLSFPSLGALTIGSVGIGGFFIIIF